MKLMKSMETISTDNLLMSLEAFFTLAFCLGFFGGMFLVFLLIAIEIPQSQKGIIGAIATIALLLFLFFANRYIRNTIIPEIRNRCRQN